MGPRQLVRLLVLVLSLSLGVSCVRPWLAGPAPGFTGAPETIDAFERAAAYQFGESRAALSEIEEMLAGPRVRAEQNRQLEDNLIALLATGTPDARRFAARELGRIGSDRAVRELARRLADPELSHMARHALQAIPGDAAARALLKGMKKTAGELRIGMINSLGDRGEVMAVGPLTRLADDATTGVAAAAIAALGKIDSAAAAEALMELPIRTLRPEPRRELQTALLRVAERKLGQGAAADAAAIYERLLAAPETQAGRIAALRGLMLARGIDARPQLDEILRGGDPAMQAQAAGFLRELAGSDLTRALLDDYDAYPAGARAALLRAAAADPAIDARPWLEHGLESDDEAVRIAALEGLGARGDAESVGRLVGRAARGEGEEADTARRVLSRIAGEGVDGAFLEVLAQGENAERLAVIAALRARGATQAVPELIAQAESDDAEVRKAALAALGELGREEHLDDLLDLLERIDPDGQAAAGAAVAEVARRLGDPEAAARPVLEKYESARTAELRARLLPVLGRLGGESALRAVRGATGAEQDRVREAAVRALAEWPSPAAMPDLLRLARQAEDRRERVLTLRGYIRLIEQIGDENEDEGQDADLSARRLEPYGQAMAAAERYEERRQVLAGVAELADPAALAFLRPCLDDAQLRDEALAAEIKVLGAIAGRDAELAASEADNLLDRVEAGQIRLKAELAEVILQAAGANAGARPEVAGELIDRVEQAAGEDAAIRERIQASREFIEQLTPMLAAWQVAGPYEKPGASQEELLAEPFAPETPAGTDEAAWRIMPTVVWRMPGAVSLGEAIGGNHRVAYLRTWVWSPRAMAARLELGSDDGIKVWLNGEPVFEHPVMRGLEAGADEAPVELRAGWNALMLKVTQATAGWGAIARLTTPDGAPIAGLRTSPRPPE